MYFDHEAYDKLYPTRRSEDFRKDENETVVPKTDETDVEPEREDGDE